MTTIDDRINDIAMDALTKAIALVENTASELGLEKTKVNSDDEKQIALKLIEKLEIQSI